MVTQGYQPQHFPITLCFANAFLSIVLAGCTTQDPPETPPRESHVSEQPADSVTSEKIRNELNEGPIKITFGTVIDEFPDQAKLVRVWELDRDGIKETGWIEQHYGDAKLVQFEIPGTSFSLLVIGGEVRPLIKVSGPWELWHIEGLDDFFQYVVAVNITERKVEFIAGGGDIRSILVFDFTHDLEMTFTQEGSF